MVFMVSEIIHKNDYLTVIVWETSIQKMSNTFLLMAGL